MLYAHVYFFIAYLDKIAPIEIDFNKIKKTSPKATTEPTPPVDMHTFPNSKPSVLGVKFSTPKSVFGAQISRPHWRIQVPSGKLTEYPDF